MRLYSLNLTSDRTLVSDSVSSVEEAVDAIVADAKRFHTRVPDEISFEQDEEGTLWFKNKSGETLYILEGKVEDGKM